MPDAAEIVRQSEEAVQRAFRTTAEQYRPYIAVLSNRKNLGDRLNPVYVTIQTAYMAVDGRIKMMTDEHRSVKAKVTITTRFETIEIPGVGPKLVCRATCDSDLLGHFEGVAMVGNGGGVDATNPLENAETSAVGRCLGFAGYGLFGGGIASYEEVVHAREAQGTSAPEKAQGDGSRSAAASSAGQDRKPTENQLRRLWALLRGAFPRLTTNEELSDALSSVIKTVTGRVAKPADLTPKEYEAVCNKLIGVQREGKEQ